MSQNQGPREARMFFILTFAFSWTVWGIAILLELTFDDLAGKLLYTLGGFGPSILGLILYYRCAPVKDRPNLWRSLVSFRQVSAGWWVIFLLVIPAITVCACLLSTWSSQGLPGYRLLNQIVHSPTLLLPSLIQLLILGPLAEEFGWRGFALPRMASYRSTTQASLLLSLIWWGWHLPLFFFIGSTQYKFGWFTPDFWLFLAQTVALGLVAGLAYLRNSNSLLAAVLAHFGSNLALNLITPISSSTRLYLAIFWWLLVVGILLATKSEHRSNQINLVQAAH